MLGILRAFPLEFFLLFEAVDARRVSRIEEIRVIFRFWERTRVEFLIHFSYRFRNSFSTHPPAQFLGSADEFSFVHGCRTGCSSESGFCASRASPKNPRVVFFCSPPASVAEKSCRSRSGGGPFSVEMLGIPSISAVAENPWVVVYGVAVRNRRSAVEFSSFSPRGGGH